MSKVFLRGGPSRSNVRRGNNLCQEHINNLSLLVSTFPFSNKFTRATAPWYLWSDDHGYRLSPNLSSDDNGSDCIQLIIGWQWLPIPLISHRMTMDTDCYFEFTALVLKNIYYCEMCEMLRNQWNRWGVATKPPCHCAGRTYMSAADAGTHVLQWFHPYDELWPVFTRCDQPMHGVG